VKKALVAMSGGVDSSVAALLLEQQGIECIGVTMRLYENEEIGIAREKTCCSLSDVEDARWVAGRLGIPYYVMNYADAFEKYVLKPFAEAYEQGHTPNPCIACNRHLKFDELLQRALVLGCDYIATGHYARVERDEESGRFLLKRARDGVKDQTYMLYTLSQETLARVRLPLGDLTKEQVRSMAEEAGLVNSRKRDSQDICFVQNGTYADFIERYTGKHYPEGDFVDMDGKVLGRHKGVIRYTIGQRKGLGLALPQSMYVVRLDLENNRVVLGFEEDLYAPEMIVRGLNLIDCETIEEPRRALVKTRYSHRGAPAWIRQTGEDEIRVRFDEPQRAITAGQSGVFYDGDTVIGGGTITEAVGSSGK